jgi:hypothetical protein
MVGLEVVGLAPAVAPEVDPPAPGLHGEQTLPPRRQNFGTARAG